MSDRSTLANAVRAFSMDAVQAANSGHPGAPMGMADIAEVLWNDFLRHNPANPGWADRDRFVLSNGHASMLLYSLLHLSGYDLPIQELKHFRQLHSMTPGHPEYGYAPGVETTTGPLGQGLANAVGMAIAERTLAAQFNRPGHELIDHRTFVFVGDGCLMEGISHEVCSLAGTLGLGKLVVFYDDNGISIDGEVEGWFTDNSAERFRAYGWQVIEGIDGHDPDAVKSAIEAALEDQRRPSFLMCRTTIGFGSPNKAGKEESHGAPLGEEEIALARQQLGWTHGPFEIPDAVRAGWDARKRGGDAEREWQSTFEAYAAQFPELAAELSRRLSGELPNDWSGAAAEKIAEADSVAATIASRKASQNALNAYGPLLPELIGGSADLAGSNLTLWSGSKDILQEPDGNYIHYGVREFGMAAISTGICLHGGFKSYSATFLMFSEYARNAIRMAALMKQPSIFVFTHDSIGLGEDGPTHQPVEQLATLRMVPQLSNWRPCDTVETMVAWKAALERSDAPSCLIFSRQNLPHQTRSAEQVNNIARGGYVLHDPQGGEPEAVIIATGSEVGLAMDAARELAGQGRRVRVVSMPSTDTFDAQSAEYRDQVLPPELKARMALEAGASDGWHKYVGLDGDVIGLNTFGESGPAAKVFEHFGFTVDNVVKRVRDLLASA